MFASRISFEIVLVVSLLALFQFEPASAQTDAAPPPPGFNLVDSAPGIRMYRKDYKGGSPDFVQVVELNTGAQIVLLHGEILESRSGKGVYGGDDPRLRSRSLQSYWGELSAEYADPFCVTNGQFFYALESPTRLPFPLKVNGTIISDGYGLNDFPEDKLILEIWPGRVNITGLSQESLYSSSAPDIVASLTENANKRAERNVGRTFVGVDDQDGDGSSETVLIFNSRLSRQKDAARILQDFGADQVMMLDGGGSTQLLCKGSSIISSDRPIPQAIGVVAAAEATIGANSSQTPDPEAGDDFVTAGSIDPSQLQPTLEIEIEQQSDAPDQIIDQPNLPIETAGPMSIQFSDVLLVPLMMSPVLAVLMIFIGKMRYRDSA